MNLPFYFRVMVMDDKANARAKIFVAEWLIDLNGTRAYMKAYGTKNKSVAAVEASKLLRKPKIQKMIQEAMKEREKRTAITQDRVLQEIARIAFANITDYLKYKPVKVKVGEKPDGTPIYENRQEIVIKPSSKVDGAPIAEVSISRRGVFTFKLHDKSRNLELLARHLGLLKDAAPAINVNINLAEEMRAARERARSRRHGTGNTGSDAGRTTTDQ